MAGKELKETESSILKTSVIDSKQQYEEQTSRPQTGKVLFPSCRELDPARHVWHACSSGSTGEAEAGGSLESRNAIPGWITQVLILKETRKEVGPC